MTTSLLPVQPLFAKSVRALSSHQRTALGFNFQHFHPLLRTTHPSRLPSPPQHFLVGLSQFSVQHRSFLASAVSSSSSSFSNTQAKLKDGKKNKGDSDNDDTGSSNYFARKAAAKAARTAAYQHKLAKAVERRGRRRKQKNDNNSSSPTHVLKPAFRQWMDRRVARDERWDRQAKQAQKTWIIRVACVVERLPVVLPDRPEWETAYEELKAYQEQWGGKQYPPEFLGNAASTTGGGGGRSSNMPDEPLTDEELLAMLPENYKPAPRETAADVDGSVDTLDRRLKDRVYLMFQGNRDGSDRSSSLYFPTTVVKDDESLLEAAQRALQEQMSTAKKGDKRKGNDAATTNDSTGKPFPLDLYCPSNMPLGVQLEARTNEETPSSSDVFGTKTFFIKVQYDDGKLTQKDVGDDKAICWLDRTEIVERMEAAMGEEEGKFYQYLL